MDYYWERPEFAALKRDLGNTRIAGVIMSCGCTSLAEFCERFDTAEMLRLPNFASGSLNKLRGIAERCGVALRDPPPPALEPSLIERQIRAAFAAGWNARDGHLGSYGTAELNEKWIEREWQDYRRG